MKFRYFNAACYLITGVALLAIEAKTSWDLKITLIALASVAYSGWVGLTRRSYWYGTFSYIIPVLAILYGFFMLSH